MSVYSEYWLECMLVCWRSYLVHTGKHLYFKKYEARYSTASDSLSDVLKFIDRIMGQLGWGNVHFIVKLCPYCW
jgi:hypothetical protein